jgi:hypothetical protein
MPDLMVWHVLIPVDLDADVAAQYRTTREKLKKYLIDRRWEGDTTFRGAYLQWSMGWPNATFRPCEVVHNIKNRLTNAVHPCTVAKLESFGEDRIYAKEQALIDLVRSELAQNRPVVIFLRQTATKDIQPRIASLLKTHVPAAKPYILKNTVEADRREKVIEAEVAKGTNVILANPELVKTGLDMVFAPTLIFYEIVFNLGTMMQAAGRSFRLNQTHDKCKTYYLYATDTMEETAVQLMSRKQRAAKLLNGEIGLTGLDALTEGEHSFEEALLKAIGEETTGLDPAQLFKRAENALDIDDLNYWNIEVPVPMNCPLEPARVLLAETPLQPDLPVALSSQPVQPELPPQPTADLLAQMLQPVAVTDWSLPLSGLSSKVVKPAAPRRVKVRLSDAPTSGPTPPALAPDLQADSVVHVLLTLGATTVETLPTLPPNVKPAEPSATPNFAVILERFEAHWQTLTWTNAAKVRRLLSQDIPTRLLADKPYANARRQGDAQNARIEHDRALGRTMLFVLRESMELYRQFADTPNFASWLADTLFELTYTPITTPPAPKSQPVSRTIPPKAKAVIPSAPGRPQQLALVV